MSRPLLADRRLASGGALLCCLLWGSAFPAVKAGLAHLAPTFFAGARFTLAGAAVLVLRRLLPAPPRSGRSAAAPVLAIALFGTVIGYWLFFHGMASASGVNGAIVNSSGPLLTFLLARWTLGEGGHGPRRWAGAVLGFLGVILSLAGPGAGAGILRRGEGLVLLSALAMAYASTIAKRIAGRVDAFLISGGSMAAGGASLLLISLASEPDPVRSWGWAAFLLLLYTSFISAAAFTLWYALLRHHRVSTISTVKFTIPLFGALLSALFLGEPLTWRNGAGVLLVGLGVWLVLAGEGGPEGGRAAESGGEPAERQAPGPFPGMV